MPGTIFIGCQEMAPGAIAEAPNGELYQQRTFPAGAITDRLGASNVIDSLVILFDEGNDQGVCPRPSGGSCTFLDNILVQTTRHHYADEVLGERERQQQPQHRPLF